MIYFLLSLSITVTETISSRAGEGDDEEQALLERLAKREERRQRRMKEALDRQKQLESTDAPSYSSYSVESSYTTSYQEVNDQEEEPAFNSKEEVKEEVEIIPQKGVEEEKPCRPSLREQVCLCKSRTCSCSLQLRVFQVEFVLMKVVHFQESTEEKAKIEDEVRLPLLISSRFHLLNTMQLEPCGSRFLS